MSDVDEYTPICPKEVSVFVYTAYTVYSVYSLYLPLHYGSMPGIPGFSSLGLFPQNPGIPTKIFRFSQLLLIGKTE